MSYTGQLITFEGLDGCGKTTQLHAVFDWLSRSGRLPEGTKVVKTREPGCLPGVRDLLKDPKAAITPKAELLLLMADRAQHVATVIMPELEQGNWVLCDRFYASTLAYQGWGRGLGPEAVEKAHELACGALYPDLELFFDVPVDESMRRLSRREGEGLSVRDRFERSERPFFDRLLTGFQTPNKQLGLKCYPVVTIDGCQTVDEITQECIRKVSKLLPREENFTNLPPCRVDDPEFWYDTSKETYKVRLERETSWSQPRSLKTDEKLC
jgi:dTMP kinase